MAFWHHSILTMSPNPFFHHHKTNGKSGLTTWDYNIAAANNEVTSVGAYTASNEHPAQ